MSGMLEVKARRLRAVAVACAAVPVIALTAGIPLANRVAPMILGVPFLLAYVTAWIVATPGFLYAAYRLMPRDD